MKAIADKNNLKVVKLENLLQNLFHMKRASFARLTLTTSQ